MMDLCISKCKYSFVQTDAVTFKLIMKSLVGLYNMADINSIGHPLFISRRLNPLKEEQRFVTIF